MQVQWGLRPPAAHRSPPSQSEAPGRTPASDVDPFSIEFRIGAERRLKLLFDDGAFARIRAGSLLARRWMELDSNLYGAFPVK
jgi:hypothetical protein